MPLAPLPFEALAEIAMAVVNSPTLPSAVELLASELSSLFATHVTVFEKRDRQWSVLAGRERGSAALDWQVSLAATLSGAPATLRISDARGEPVTAISLTGPRSPELVLVLDGDWTADQSTLNVFAMLVSIGLDSLRHNDERRIVERRLVQAYALARRASRTRSVEEIAQQVVDGTAELLDADRVSLALYDRNEDALFIAATHGYPVAQVKHVRISPGAWVTGHVYSHARPLFVGDARFFPGMRHEQYQTHSFAAVPLIAGRETIGVLSVTEKRHRDQFDRADEMALRGVSAIAGLALVAARSTAEAAKLAHAATVDSVTNLLNRPYLDSRLREEVARSKREGATLAVLIGDIDDFKRINDALGHQAGDHVLAVVGGIIRSAVRVFDVCARYGGDEFAVLMPNCDEQSALACAERIRKRVAEHDGSSGGVGLPPLTMSIGAAVIERDEDGPALISRADRYLYQAKADGKNLVRAASTEDHRRRTESAGLRIREGSAPYVLVADANDARAALCVGVARRFGMRTSVARSSHHALSVIAQLGHPAVLTIDLSLPPTDGFAVLEALGDDRRPDIIAWSASREITEYAASRPQWPKAHVLSDRAAASTIELTVEKLVRRHAAEQIAEPERAAPAPANPDKIMNALAEKTRQLCDTAGVAVYLKARGDTGFRTVLHWTSEEALPHLPYAVPHAVNQVIESGRPIVGRDRRGSTPPHDLPDEALDETTRGLAAVPIMCDGETIGAICVFDVEPLVLDERAAAALVAIGRDAFSNPPVPAPSFRDRAVDRRRDTAASFVAQTEQQSEWPPTILERKGGEFAVARELARARREGRQLSVVLFDVRPAAAVESPGQTSPQKLVEAVSDTLLRTIRQSDLPIRWDVGELLVVLPGLKGTEARSVAERVRAALQAGAGHRFSVSGGVAELESDERFADVVERARQKVAMAVGRGHNRVL